MFGITESWDRTTHCWYQITFQKWSCLKLLFVKFWRLLRTKFIWGIVYDEWVRNTKNNQWWFFWPSLKQKCFYCLVLVHAWVYSFPPQEFFTGFLCTYVNSSFSEKQMDDFLSLYLFLLPSWMASFVSLSLVFLLLLFCYCVSTVELSPLWLLKLQISSSKETMVSSDRSWHSERQ